MACMVQRSDLQQQLQGNKVTSVLLEKKVEDASLAELVEGHNSKHGSPECQKQQQPTGSWLSISLLRY
ncbi:hypothetical protein GQ457_18G014580 [Hibiscus cannabinus]